MSRSRVLADLGGQSLATDAELSDAVATKASYVYSATAPASPSNGNLWMDISTAVPKGKVWNGSEWKLFSGAGAADFSNTATGTYTLSGVTYKYVTFTSSGTLTVTAAGIADVFIIAGGGAGFQSGSDAGYNSGGGAGGVVNGIFQLTAGAMAVTVGAAGGVSSLGATLTAQPGQNASANNSGAQGRNFQSAGFLGQSGYTNWGGGGAGGPCVGGAKAPGLDISITGSTVTYGIPGAGYYGASAPTTANQGHGGTNSSSGTSGVVIVRVVA